MIENFETNQLLMAGDEGHGGLGDLYSAGDYPVSGALTEAFIMTWCYFMLNAPTSLKRLNAALFQEQKKQLQVEWTHALQEWNDLLLEQAKELLDTMNEQLEPGDSGKPKSMTTRWGRKMLEFIDAFGEKNLADNKDFADVLDNIRNLVNNTDAKRTRSDTGVYQQLRERFTQLREQVSGMVTERRRKISFGEVIEDPAEQSSLEKASE